VVPKAIVASEASHQEHDIYQITTNIPPSCNDKDKSDVVAAGLIVRVMGMSNWAIPFVAPASKDARLGDAAETYMKIQPGDCKTRINFFLHDR
jgi:hypothetical protein